MNANLKAKEPWLAVLLNFIYPGLGQLYAGKRTKAIIIIGVTASLFLVAFGYIYIMVDPEAEFTVNCLLIGILLVLVSAVCGLYVLVDGFLCARACNLSNKLCQTNKAIRILSIIGCVFLFLTGGWQELILGKYIKNNYAQAFKVSTGTMAPALQRGDRILANKNIYSKNKPRRNDIIIFRYPLDRKKVITKRVIGLPGETLEIKSGRVFIDGKKINSRSFYLNMGEHGKSSIKIPQGRYFVLGDNSKISKDSRYFGSVPEKDILGKVAKIYWPPHRVGKVE